MIEDETESEMNLFFIALKTEHSKWKTDRQHRNKWDAFDRAFSGCSAKQIFWIFRMLSRDYYFENYQQKYEQYLNPVAIR